MSRLHSITQAASRRLAITMALTMALAVSVCSNAFAAYDYDQITTGLGGEVTAVVGVTLAALGTVGLAILGIRFLRKMLRI